MLPTQTFLALLPLFLSLTLVCAAPQNAGSTASLRLARGRATTTSSTPRAVAAASTTTTRSTTSAPAASSSAPPASSGPSDAWSQGILAAHNSARNSHGAGNLVWAQDLVDAAKAWSDGCVWVSHLSVPTREARTHCPPPAETWRQLEHQGRSWTEPRCGRVDGDHRLAERAGHRERLDGRGERL